ncbi:kinase-like domain-containing protein [Jimgerdemannia flammicorona]|uniref:Kinase-like domain-containing protein n=1 Tax=Jimgerdemannia flammicorona TaxID=994334 RepID=A0A433QU16_9FUNG|nr:kinase-like domain-containing protein [Jimgerdemannia flammicorona]
MLCREQPLQPNASALMFGVNIIGEPILKGMNSAIYKTRASDGTVHFLKVVDNWCIGNNLPAAQHPNIRRVIHHHKDQNAIYLLMEPVIGSLYSQFMSMPKEGECQIMVDDLNVQMNIKFIFSQVLDILYYLHGCGIYHHNLEPQSIFYTFHPDNMPEVKLFDFDCTTIHADDVQSFGISLYQVLMNQVSIISSKQAIINEVLNDDSAFQHNYTPVFSEFIRGILHPEVDHRWSLAKACTDFALIDAFWLPRVTEDEPECRPKCEECRGL